MWFKFEEVGISFAEGVGVGANRGYWIWSRTNKAMHHLRFNKGTGSWRGLCLQDKEKKI
jgi:hypothetical protein